MELRPHQIPMMVLSVALAFGSFRADSVYGQSATNKISEPVLSFAPMSTLR